MPGALRRAAAVRENAARVIGRMDAIEVDEAASVVTLPLGNPP